MTFQKGFVKIRFGFPLEMALFSPSCKLYGSEAAMSALALRNAEPISPGLIYGITCREYHLYTAV